MRPSFLIIAFCMVLRGTDLFGCSLPLETRKAAFVAKVQIQGKGPFRFLLDTGTSVTVISPTLADRLGVARGNTIAALSTTGSVPVSEAILHEVKAGSIAAPELRVLIAPVPQWARYGRIDGILGMNLLAGRSYLLDVRRRCLSVDVEKKDLSGGSRLKAREIVGRVAVESHSMLFVLDSAASLAVLASDRATALAQRGGFTEVGSSAGRQQVASGVVPRLRLGTVELENIPAVLMSQPEWKEDALLPVNVFSSVFVDADRSTVVLNGTVRD